MTNIKILLAQINPCVADIAGNQRKISEIILNNPQYDIIVFPELVICGYPPEDLLLYQEFQQQISEANQAIADLNTSSIIIFGTVHNNYNAAAIIRANHIDYYYKQVLPNYGVFDEKRYFNSSHSCYSFSFKDHRFGIMICEDLWNKECVSQLDNIDTLIAINASPYEIGKNTQRAKLLSALNINSIYVNQCGGQDGLVFDGRSMVYNNRQQLIASAQAFQEDLLPVTISAKQIYGEIARPLELAAEIYAALVLGLRDFFKKNGFSHALLGLSGGIDSALTLAIACDAIGSDKLSVLLMPSQYTSPASVEDAIKQASELGVSYDIIEIDDIVASFSQALPAAPAAITLQNLQARARGVLLMAHANQHQALLINTSNKSEAAVGYGTLYGDMCGGYAPLQDVYKTTVYTLAAYRNSISPIIPERVLSRPPSAELAPNQTDQDDLPSYDILDKLLIDFIEKRHSTTQLISTYGQAMVNKILDKIKVNEFKRFQSPPGPKITAVAFGKDWRMPITKKWH